MGGQSGERLQELSCRGRLGSAAFSDGIHHKPQRDDTGAVHQARTFWRLAPVGGEDVGDGGPEAFQNG